MDNNVFFLIVDVGQSFTTIMLHIFFGSYFHRNFILSFLFKYNSDFNLKPSRAVKNVSAISFKSKSFGNLFTFKLHNKTDDKNKSYFF